MENSNPIDQLEKEAVNEPVAAPAAPIEDKPKAPETAEKKEGKTVEKTPDGLREMLEKNLKWSQIIYEQNRRISRRLLWSLIASWVKWILLIIIIILGIWYAWPIYRSFESQYSTIVNQLGQNKPLDKAGLEKILKMIPMNAAQQEQIKALLK